MASERHQTFLTSTNIIKGEWNGSYIAASTCRFISAPHPQYLEVFSNQSFFVLYFPSISIQYDAMNVIFLAHWFLSIFFFLYQFKLTKSVLPLHKGMILHYIPPYIHKTTVQRHTSIVLLTWCIQMFIYLFTHLSVYLVETSKVDIFMEKNVMWTA